MEGRGEVWVIPFGFHANYPIPKAITNPKTELLYWKVQVRSIQVGLLVLCKVQRPRPMRHARHARSREGRSEDLLDCFRGGSLLLVDANRTTRTKESYRSGFLLLLGLRARMQVPYLNSFEAL